jgi:hypothetical protein
MTNAALPSLPRFGSWALMVCWALVLACPALPRAGFSTDADDDDAGDDDAGDDDAGDDDAGDDDATDPPACTDDAFEDNDFVDEATPLSGPLSALACPEDEDFFRVDLGPGSVLVIDLDFVPAEGLVDASFIDPEGQPVGDIERRKDGLTVRLDAERGGPHHLGVFLAEDRGLQPGTPYSLAATIDNSAVPGCPDDPFEPNTTPTEDALLQAGTTSGLILCDDIDSDWFAVDLQAGDRIDVAATNDPSALLIDLGLFLPGGLDEVEDAQSYYPSVDLAYVATSTGRWFIRVNAIEDADAAVSPGGTYDLDIQIRPGWGGLRG